MFFDKYGKIYAIFITDYLKNCIFETLNLI